MRLVLIGGINFLNGIELFGAKMEPLPDLAEPSSSQLLPFEVTLDEGLVF